MAAHAIPTEHKGRSPKEYLDLIVEQCASKWRQEKLAGVLWYLLWKRCLLQQIYGYLLQVSEMGLKLGDPCDEIESIGGVDVRRPN